MAVEIKELIVRAVLAEDEEGTKTPVQPVVDQEAIIQECVDQVLKILKKKSRR